MYTVSDLAVQLAHNLTNKGMWLLQRSSLLPWLHAHDLFNISYALRIWNGMLQLPVQVHFRLNLVRVSQGSPCGPAREFSD